MIRRLNLNWVKFEFDLIFVEFNSNLFQKYSNLTHLREVKLKLSFEFNLILKQFHFDAY